MEIDNISLETLKHHISIARYDYFVNEEDTTLLIFNEISDQTIIEGINILNDTFDLKYSSNEIVIKLEDVINYLNTKGFIFDSDIDKSIKIIEEHLSGKAIVMDEYFVLNSSNKYIRTANVINIIDQDIKQSDRYFVCPILDQDKYNSFLDLEEFNLNYLNLNIDLLPHYLVYKDKIFNASLKYTSNGVIQDEAVYRALNVKTEELSDNIIVCEDLLFIKKLPFIEKLYSNKMLNNSNSDISNELDKLADAIQSEGLIYSKEDIYNFYTCLEASELVILAGMSGTGKTQLPLSFAKYFNMSEDKHTLLFVPISPSYLEPSDILGFLNPNTNEYVPSQTGMVEFLRHAESKPNKMHMVIFDEMNLSQIEYWFAPFLSILEQDPSDRYLELYSSDATCKNSDKYPSKIKIGNNIVFVGTINLDETTKNISDRLKDRSFIINLSKSTFLEYYNEQSTNNTYSCDTYDRDFFTFTKRIDNNFNYIKSLDIEIIKFLDEVHEKLNEIDYQSGISFRTVKNISHYMHYKPSKLDSKLAFDLAFKQTVMKKLSGDCEFILKVIGKSDNESLLAQIFDKYSNISNFTYSRKEMRIKRQEIDRFGYAK